VTERYPAQFLDRSYLVDCLRNDREQLSRPRVKQQWLIAIDQELVEHEVRFGDVDRNSVDPSPDRADAMAIAFAGRANAAPMNVESHAGESITGDPMTKAW
jgi:hypothetical protein